MGKEGKNYLNLKQYSRTNVYKLTRKKAIGQSNNIHFYWQIDWFINVVL